MRAGLHDASIFARSVDHLAAFPNIVRHRFLHVDILACLYRPDRRERMPVVRRRDGNGVDVRVLEQPPDVLITGDLLDVFILEILHLFVAQTSPSTSHSAAMRIALRLTQAAKMILAAAMKADHGHADVPACAAHTLRTEAWPRGSGFRFATEESQWQQPERRGGERGLFQKLAATNILA